MVDGAKEVEAYLAKVEEPARGTLEKLRELIRKTAPKEAEECICYGMPAFKYKGGLVGYAAFKKHCSLFPMGANVLDEMGEELSAYRTSKGTLQFASDKGMPSALVRKIVKLRVAQNEAKAAAKKKK